MNAYLRGAVLGTLSLVLIACTAPQPPPVPVVGAVGDIRALVGQWDGTYASAATGRNGTISFALTATGDSAFGEVIMIPRGFGRPLQAWGNAGGAPTPSATPAHAAALTINFVRIAAGRVSGTLTPYADPETGERLFTTFEGRLQGDVIRGTYATRTAGTSEPQTGEWSVKRRRG